MVSQFSFFIDRRWTLRDPKGQGGRRGGGGGGRGGGGGGGAVVTLFGEDGEDAWRSESS